jgi:hypothetical protein
MAYIRVVYKTKDCNFDYVRENRLETMILREEISHFYRPSERQWIRIKFDAVREGGEEMYPGPERRKTGKSLGVESQKKEGIFPKGQGPQRIWLESLWPAIER